jgi:hypothetical protein
MLASAAGQVGRLPLIASSARAMWTALPVLAISRTTPRPAARPAPPGSGRRCARRRVRSSSRPGGTTFQRAVMVSLMVRGACGEEPRGRVLEPVSSSERASQVAASTVACSGFVSRAAACTRRRRWEAARGRGVRPPSSCHRGQRLGPEARPPGAQLNVASRRSDVATAACAGAAYRRPAPGCDEHQWPVFAAGRAMRIVIGRAGGETDIGLPTCWCGCCRSALPGLWAPPAAQPSGSAPC